MKLSAAGAALIITGATAGAMVPGPDQGKPNFVFILSDDQDAELDSVAYMPRLRQHLAARGTTFNSHYVTTAVCCPSRVSLWTGRQPHNTNVTDVKPPWGGYPKFVAQGFNDAFLPVWLQQNGYNTYYTGKMFNAHTVNNYNKPFLNGFNGSDFLLDPYTYDYLHPVFQRNHDPPWSYAGHHSNDVLNEKTIGFLDNALAVDKPFFLVAAPIAPHSNIDAVGWQSGSTVMTEPIPLDRHKELFPDEAVPRTPNFNPDTPTGASWVKTLAKQNQSTVAYHDHFHRQRLRALQGVDELVEEVVSRLDDSGKLANTYIIFTSDNGYHIGQHRLPPGKTCGYEEDIHVPFMIRGPGISEGAVETAVTTHIDFAPTIFKLAGIEQRSDFDGAPMPLDYCPAIGHEYAAVEYWGTSVLEGLNSMIGPGGKPSQPNNTYKAVRLLAPDYNLYYAVWCTNEHELYDLSTDRYQLHNLYPSPTATSPSSSSHSPDIILSRPLNEVIARLDAALLVLKSCRGPGCVDPWSVLHRPDDDVHSLGEALNPKFDALYAKQPQTAFERCELGYIIESEGPQEPVVDYGERCGLSWDAWV